MKYHLTILCIFYLTTVQAQVTCEQLISKIEIKPDTLSNEPSFIEEHRKIGKIEDSQSNFEIRYYFTPSLVNGGSVTIINCDTNELIAKQIDYWFNPNKPSDKRKIIKVKITELTPANSWQLFFDSLMVMNFFEFPTMEEVRPKMKKYMQLADGRTVEKRAMITDGATFTYQVKINDSIRTFTYHSPSSWYQVYDNVEELKIADDINNLFANELTEK